MKKEESNIGQLSLFDVIDGGKHGEAENVNLIKIKHKIMVDAAEFESIDEIFSGYSKLQVITFSYNWDFINKLLKYFEYVEIILGATCIVDKDSKMPYIFANATQIQKAACKYKRVSDMLQSGKLIIKVSTTIVDHRKLYILTSDNGDSKVVDTTANMSRNAWDGSHMENYNYDDSELGYEDAIAEFDAAWSMAEEIPYSCITTKTITSEEDMIENNPIITKIKKMDTAIVLREDTSQANLDYVNYCIEYQKDVEFYKKVTKNIGLKTEKGLTQISSRNIKRMESNFRRSLNGQKCHVSVEKYPELTFDYDSEKAYLNGEELNLHPSEDEVKHDISELLKIFNNYDEFINGRKYLQPNHFKLLNAVFSSPFTSKLRNDADITGVGDGSLPLFMLLVSKNPSVGKTFMMSVILKLMTGKNIPEEKGVEVGKDKLKALQTGSKGIPIFVDEISSGYISQKGDYLKNPEQCERLSLHCMPLVVFASNEILSLEEKYRKRIMLISYEGCLPSTVDQSEYKSRGKAILNRLTNAFYREYLRRMLPQINDVVRHMYDIEHREDGYYPDIMSISSNVIIDILNEYGYDIPEYIRPLTWNHDYSINATSVSSDALEQIEGLYKTNKKDFIIDTVADTVTLVLGKTGEIEKMFLAWERCLPNEICAESTPSRDVCRIKFKKTQLETFLGHTLSNGFMSFIQSKRRR